MRMILVQCVFFGGGGVNHYVVEFKGKELRGVVCLYYVYSGPVYRARILVCWWAIVGVAAAPRTVVNHE